MNPRSTLIFLIVLIMLFSACCFTPISCRALSTDDTGSSVVTLEAIAPSSSSSSSTSSSTSYILAKDGRKLLVTIRAHHNAVANRKVRTPKNPYDKEGLRFRRRR